MIEKKDIDFLQQYNFAVLPVRHRSKVINLKTWDFTEAPTQQQTEDFYQQNLFQNICVLVGPPSNNLAVIDIDKPDYIPMDLLKELISDDDKIPIGFLAQTGRGYQLWLQNKTNVPLYNGGSPTYKLDLFAERHIVVAPPSVHPSGKQYKFLVVPEQLKPVNVNNRFNQLKMYCIRHDPDVILKPIMNPLVRQKIMAVLQDPKCDGSTGHYRRLWLTGFLYTTLKLPEQDIIDFISRFNRWEDFDLKKTSRNVHNLLSYIDRKVGGNKKEGAP